MPQTSYIKRYEHVAELIFFRQDAGSSEKLPSPSLVTLQNLVVGFVGGPEIFRGAGPSPQSWRAWMIP